MTRLSYKVVVFCFKRPLSTTTSNSSNLSAVSMSSAKKSYEFTIAALNSLQSNAETVAKCRSLGQQSLMQNLRSSVSYFQRSGLELEDLVPLKIIHIAGTKGKGSVCALTESVLRSHGYKTGLFSSPHLVHVTERIKINGQMISKEDFCRHFWTTYERLEATKTAEDSSMPAYFKFLFIMACHVFLKEKVDVAIVEVGIGGAYDCTNIITEPIVCAITTLDYDHIEILGDTLEKISWQKAGIFKENSVALCANQEPQALSVIKERSKELRCPCFVVPPFSSYKKAIEIGIPGLPQKENASLAAQICRLWMIRTELRNKDSHLKNGFIPCTENGLMSTVQPFDLTDFYIQGLQNCKLSGRCQTLMKSRFTYFLDGAHTPKSLKYCVQWFRDKSSPNATKVLMFNCTSGRDSKLFLRHLKDCAFDAAIFCPNVVSSKTSLSSDTVSVKVTSENALKVCTANQKTWLDLNNNNASNDEHNSSLQLFQNTKHCETLVQPCISSALSWISDNFCSKESVAVLITGSLHLVGGALSILDPDIIM